jgi:DNA-binding transcriptional ArsR family regulator
MKVKIKKSTVSMIKSLSEMTRLKVIMLLAANGEMCVGDILKSVKVEPTLLSHHLSVFKDLDLVKTKRVGKRMFYSINDKAVNLNKKSIDVGDGMTFMLPK